MSYQMNERTTDIPPGPDRTKAGGTGDGKRGAALPPPGSQRRRILVVDDSPETPRLIEHWTREYDLVVVFADDAPEAFRQVLDQSFELVLLDLHLPSMSGLDVLKGIRSIERTRDRAPVRVVCLTASWEDRDKCLAAGFDGFLTKPIDRSALFSLLGWEAGRGAASDPASQEDPDLADLIPAFIRHGRRDIISMKAFLDAGDFESVESIAHRIRGTAGNFGFPEMAQAGRRLEQAARAKDLAFSLAWLLEIEVCLLRRQRSDTRTERAAAQAAS